MARVLVGVKRVIDYAVKVSKFLIVLEIVSVFSYDKYSSIINRPTYRV